MNSKNLFIISTKQKVFENGAVKRANSVLRNGFELTKEKERRSFIQHFHEFYQIQAKDAKPKTQGAISFFDLKDPIAH